MKSWLMFLYCYRIMSKKGNYRYIKCNTKINATNSYVTSTTSDNLSIRVDLSDDLSICVDSVLTRKWAMKLKKEKLCSYILSRKNEQILKYRLLSFNYIKYASKKSHSRFLEWSNLRNRLQIREGKERRKCIMRPRDGLLICLVYPVYTWNNVIQFVKKHIVPPLKFNFKKSSRVLTATYINWYNLRILILTPRCEQDLKIFRFL